MRQVKILRTWSVVLVVLGISCFVSAALAVTWWALSAEAGWRTAAGVAIGVPLSLLLAAGPLALAQALRVLAGIAEDMEFESLATRASSSN